MAIFMVSYDLHQDEGYEKLTDALEKYPSYWHCLESTWLILSDDTATEIKKNLRQHILKDDRLLVMRYGRPIHGKGANASWVGFEDTCKDWLSTHL